VQLLLDYIREYGRSWCMATILNDNLRSTKLIESLDFVQRGQSRPGETLYIRAL
jgi:L-amino acid N-acyltransferase YncA